MSNYKHLATLQLLQFDYYYYYWISHVCSYHLLWMKKTTKQNKIKQQNTKNNNISYLPIYLDTCPLK